MLRRTFLCPGRPPHVANWRAVEALGLELAGCRRQMLLALANSTVPGQRVQQGPVNPPVEWSEPEPLFQMVKNLVIRRAADEVLQQGGVAAAKTTALRDEPSIESRIALDLHPFEKISGEQRGQRLQPLRSERRDVVARSWSRREAWPYSTCVALPNPVNFRKLGGQLKLGSFQNNLGSTPDERQPPLVGSQLLDPDRE